MFWLTFFKTVKRVLAWTEEPPRLTVLNEHKSYLARTRKEKLQNVFVPEQDLNEGDKYIATTYIPYFGLTLRPGCKMDHHIFVSEQTV